MICYIIAKYNLSLDREIEHALYNYNYYYYLLKFSPRVIWKIAKTTYLPPRVTVFNISQSCVRE